MPSVVKTSPSMRPLVYGEVLIARPADDAVIDGVPRGAPDVAGDDMDADAFSWGMRGTENSVQRYLWSGVLDKRE